MKTWKGKTTDLLPDVRYASQNGVPIIIGFDPGDPDVCSRSLVARWGEGNWSGSADKKLRTMRAGAALQEARESGSSFMLFSRAQRPRRWPVSFRLTECSYAMLLDMNALEHTYLAVYGGGPNLTCSI